MSVTDSIVWYLVIGMWVAFFVFVALFTGEERGQDLSGRQMAGVLFLVMLLWPFFALFGVYKLIRLGIMGLFILSKDAS